MSGLGLIYLMATVVVPRVLVTLTKAAPSSKVSLNNSYFIGVKYWQRLMVKRLVWLMCLYWMKRGRGIRGKGVELSGVDEPQTEMSGDDGRATFEVKSTKEGQFTLEASVEGMPLLRTVKVTFRN